MHSTSKPADGSVSDEDFGGEFADFGSGFDPDAYGGAGGAEMKVLPNAGRLGSRQLANDGVQPDDAWEGDAESAMLLSGQAAKQQQVGLAQTQKARKSRERRWCVSMLLLVAAWLFAGIVVALSWSLSPAFPRTPANHDLPDVPLLKLTVADWVSGRASGVPGGGYAAPNTSLPAVLPVPGSTVDEYGQWKYAAGDAEMEAEAFDGVIEGSIAAGSWKLFKYRQLMLNATFATEFHLRLPVLKDLLRTNTSRPPCAGGGNGQVSAIALARVGLTPSLLDHDASSCNGCDDGHRDSEHRCALICGAQQWVYVAVFAPLPEQRQITPAPPNATGLAARGGGDAAGAGAGFKGERVNAAGGVYVAASQSTMPVQVPFKFRVAADGRRFAHVFDLPHCGFAQEGYSPKMLYWVFLPALFLGLPVLALVVGCAVMHSWRIYSGSTSQVLDSLVGGPRTPNRHRGSGSRKGT